MTPSAIIANTSEFYNHIAKNSPCIMSAAQRAIDALHWLAKYGGDKTLYVIFAAQPAIQFIKSGTVGIPL